MSTNHIFSSAVVHDPFFATCQYIYFFRSEAFFIVWHQWQAQIQAEKIKAVNLAPLNVMWTCDQIISLDTPRLYASRCDVDFAWFPPLNESCIRWWTMNSGLRFSTRLEKSVEQHLSGLLYLLKFLLTRRIFFEWHHSFVF